MVPLEPSLSLSNEFASKYILETMFPASLLTGAKHSAFSTNHLIDNDITKHSYNQQEQQHTKTKQLRPYLSARSAELMHGKDC